MRYQANFLIHTWDYTLEYKCDSCMKFSWQIRTAKKAKLCTPRSHDGVSMRHVPWFPLRDDRVQERGSADAERRTTRYGTAPRFEWAPRARDGSA
jgi:hypothetical protein